MSNYVEIFKALADRTRLRIMRLLSITDRQVCVCEIVDALELPQYQISKHLNILKHANLVEGERKGTWVYYSPVLKNFEFNQKLFRLLREQLSEGEYLEDAEKLNERLHLRDGDTCVVGFSGNQTIQMSKCDRKQRSQ